jgi:hypothetical protein
MAASRLVADPPDPEPVVLDATPPSSAPEPPLAHPLTLGVQVKPAPQSVSTLHWNCHLYPQVDTVVGVQGGTGVGVPRSHFVLGGQAGVVAPAHAGYVSVWQIMFAPQSASVAQGPGSQKPVAMVPASTAGAGSTTGQVASGAQAGAPARVGSAVGASMQVKPFLQSAVVWHC